MTRFITTPFRAILWREWRESWFATPIAAAFTLAGGVIAVALQNSPFAADPLFAPEIFLLIGACAGLLWAGALAVLPRQKQIVQPLPSDLLRLPLSTSALTAVLVVARLAHAAVFLLGVQAVCAFVFPEALAVAADIVERVIGTSITFAGLQYRFAVFLLLLQGAAWCSGRFVGLLTLLAGGTIGLLVIPYSSHDFFNDPYRLAGIGACGLALCFAGMRAERQGWFQGAVPALPSLERNALVFRRMSPLRAQSRYEYRLYGRWYAFAAPCVVATFMLYYGLMMFGPHLGDYLRTEQFLLYQFQHQAKAFVAGLLLLCFMLGLHLAVQVNRVFNGSGGRYSLTLPLQARTAADARVIVVLRCIGTHAVWAVAATAIYTAVAVAFGAEFEWSWLPEGLATMSAELLHGLVLAFLAASLPWVFLPVFSGIMLLEGAISAEFLPLSFIRVLQCAVLLSPWAFILAVLLRRGGVTRAQIVRGAAVTALLAALYLADAMSEVPGAIPPIAGLAFAAMPVTVYFFWLALFTRMRGR